MALLFGDGFDHYATANLIQKWDAWISDIVDVNATWGRLGSQGLRTGAPGTSGTKAGMYGVVKNLLAANSTFGIFGVALYVPTYNLSGFRRNIFSLYDEAGGGPSNHKSQMHLCLEQDGSFTVRYHTIAAGDYSAALATSLPGRVPAATWVYVEMKAKTHSGSGEVIVLVNGEEVMNETGLDTANQSANNYFTAIGLGGSDGSSIVGTITYFDDFYYCDDSGTTNDDFLGDVQLGAIYPEADTATADWTPLAAGDNYAEVDETTPDDDTSYVSSATVNDEDLYEMEDVPATAITIFGLLCNGRVKKDDSTVREYALLVESGGTVGQLTTRTTPFGAYVNQQDVSEVNPDTSAQWTPAEVNAMTAGIKVVT